MKTEKEPNNKVIIYNTGDGKTEIEVRLEDETVWLNQKQMAELFQKDIRTISEHIQNVYLEKELEKNPTIRNFRIVQKEGFRAISRNIEYFNLDVIISVGYRVKSLQGTQFRIWATQKLKEYIVKGFVMNDERLANGRVKKGFFEEWLERVRKIRASEKNLYEKIKDIFATSVDYNPRTDFTKKFYAAIQNKFHYAITGKTAAELVVKRIDGKKENLGMTVWEGPIPTRKEAGIAKNYMLETELRQLYLLAEQFLSFAELQIERKNIMHMKDWLEYLHKMLEINKLKVLPGKGSISHEKMEKVVKKELKRFLEQRKLK